MGFQVKTDSPGVPKRERSIFAPFVKRPSSEVPGKPKRGMTLIEVTISLAVVTVAVYFLSSTVVSVLMHARSKEERSIAVDAAMNQLELMRSIPFEQVFATYNRAPEDDPAGHGTAPGSTFAVEGLDGTDSSLNGHAGMVILPGDGPVLREDVVIPELTMPRDLNGDIRVDNQDHSDDFILLPVTVRVRWSGHAGVRQFQMSTLMSKLRRASS